jgi:hypothetical protein
MKKIFLLPVLFFSISLNAQINKIDHFFMSSPKAEALFNLFTAKFGLPQVWDYKHWGGFSSGAVSLGNVALEFVNYKGATKTKFEGIALEPHQPAEEILKILDDVKVMHDTIEPTISVISNGMTVSWANMSLKNLLPGEAWLFICDYKNREKILLNSKRSADSLRDKKGGPLGVISLKEIVIGSTNFSFHKTELAKLPGIKPGKNDVFNFKQGPSLQLKKSNTNGIEKIVVKVYSIEIAKAWLRSQNILGRSYQNIVSIDPQALGGLVVELTDK